MPFKDYLESAIAPMMHQPLSPICQDNSQCPIQFVVDLIGSKWAILILRELFKGSCRTHDFTDRLPGLSTKTLMVRLKELERHGLIERRVYAEIPPHVEYSLTPKGREIQPVLIALYDVGHRWLAQTDCTCPITD
ncbi:MAG: winged helix-turn-helix transcriptional regulator [Thainema sp.]